MNVDDLRIKLKELHKKQQDNLSRRRTLIKEIRNMPFSRTNHKKLKLNDGSELPKDFDLNIVGAREERAEKQKQLDQKVPTALKDKDKRLAKFLLGNHLQRAKRDLDGQKIILDKQIEISKRLDDKDKRELQDIKEDQDKKKDQLVTERKQLEKELAADEYKRQSLLLDLQIRTMRDFFITKAYPNILWQPAKTNEGMNPLKEYSSEKFGVIELMKQELEKELKERLQKAYALFSDFQQQKQKEQPVEQEHESSQSESEESQVKPKEEGQE